MPIIEREPCYIYNLREYQEHSLILEAISLNLGAIAILARGAKRPDSPLQGLFQPFTPLLLTLQLGQKGDLYYLKDYEYCQGGYHFKMPEFICAFYLNELLHHLYHSKESDRLLFGHYIATLEAIERKDRIEHHLRSFELHLLKSLGYALSPFDENGQPVVVDKSYRFCFGVGFVEVDPDFMAQVMRNPRVVPNQEGYPSSEPVGESAMLFAKSRIRGPKFTVNSVGANPIQDAWVQRALSLGVSSSLIQRYCEYGVDLLGPILTGAQIQDIVSLECKLPNSSHNAKLLTSSVINRLLGGRELNSRKLYRDYLRDYQQKSHAAPAPQPASAPTSEVSANSVSMQDTASAPAPAIVMVEPKTSAAPVPALERKDFAEEQSPVAPVNVETPSKEFAEPASAVKEPAVNVEIVPVVESKVAIEEQAAEPFTSGIESAVNSKAAIVYEAQEVAEDQTSALFTVEAESTVNSEEISSIESNKPVEEQISEFATAQTVTEAETSVEAIPVESNVEQDLSSLETIQSDAGEESAVTHTVNEVETSVEATPVESNLEFVEVSESEQNEANSEPEANAEIECAVASKEYSEGGMVEPPMVDAEPVAKVAEEDRAEQQSDELVESQVLDSVVTKEDAAPISAHEITPPQVSSKCATKTSHAKKARSDKPAAKVRKSSGIKRKAQKAESASENVEESKVIKEAKVALAEAEELLVLAPQMLPEAPNPESAPKPLLKPKKVKKLTRAQIKAQEKAEAEARVAAEQERLASSPYDESMLMMLDASLTKRKRRKKSAN